MKLKYSLLVVVLSLGLLLTGCTSGNKMDFYNQTHSINLSGENCNDISLGTPEDELLKKFNNPNEVEGIEKPVSRYYIYDDMEFHVEEEKVVRYSFTDEKYLTARSITIGDTKKGVIQAYGENYYERSDTGSAIIGYFDKQHDQNIEFIFDDELLIGVMVSITKSGAQ